MRKIRQIARRLIQIGPLIILIILSGVIQTRSQEITRKPEGDSVTISPTTADAGECPQLLNKALDAYEKANRALVEKTAENQTNIDLRVKEEAYNGQLLEAMKLLTGAERRDKSFFRKLTEQLAKILQAATDPKTLVEIAALIVITKNLSK